MGRGGNGTHALLEHDELFLGVDQVQDERVGARQDPGSGKRQKKKGERVVSAEDDFCEPQRIFDASLPHPSCFSTPLSSSRTFPTANLQMVKIQLDTHKLRKRVKPVRYMLRWL